MANASIAGGFTLPTMLTMAGGSGVFGSQTGNMTAGSSYGVVFKAPRAGKIDAIGWYHASVTGPFNPFTVGLQGIDATGAPSGTFLGATSNAQAAYTPVAGWQLVTLAEKVTVNPNDNLSIVWTAPASSPGSAGMVQLNMGHVYIANPYTMQKSSFGSWALWSGSAANSMACFAVHYDDGTYAMVPYSAPLTAATKPAINSTTNPAQVGMRFSLPGPARLKGFFLNHENSWAGDAEIVLYGATGAYASLIGKATVLATDGRGVAGAQTIMVPASSGAGTILPAGQNLRLALRPTSANNVIYNRLTHPSPELAAAFYGLAGACLTQCSTQTPTDLSTWTDFTSNSVFNMGLWLDGIDDGSGGAGPVSSGLIIGGFGVG